MENGAAETPSKRRTRAQFEQERLGDDVSEADQRKAQVRKSYLEALADEAEESNLTAGGAVEPL